jgi:hypothetical protein
MPFNDNRMVYNFEKHRYVLTEEHVLETMNIDLRDVLNTSMSADVANAVDRFLDRVSREVYAFIYRTAAYTKRTERALAIEPQARDMLLGAMEEQLLYVMQNGDFSLYAGVNVQSGATVDRNRLRAAEIAPIACDLIMESGYACAVLKRHERDITPLYEEEGY